MAVSFWVLIGSALGGLARYWLGVAVAAWLGTAFPWGTLLINVLGSFVIGLFAAATDQRGLFAGALAPDGSFAGIEVRAFVMVGLCGGFTTFSAFSLQSLELLQAGRSAAAAAYAAGSVGACILSVWAGWALGR
ncbi:MAG: fluoride efflux transporter CrcB [Gemmatimonadaceae bacterium]|nr:fluoride efflux transporter CrcB [Acetobacteraceae bacterium]